VRGIRSVLSKQYAEIAEGNALRIRDTKNATAP
jgi:hypothetical protein